MHPEGSCAGPGEIDEWHCVAERGHGQNKKMAGRAVEALVEMMTKQGIL